MKVRNTIKPVVNMIVVVLFAFFISGCVDNLFSKKPEKNQLPATQPKSPKSAAVYYDFEDVLIPLALSIVKDRTVVISTPGFTSGILTLKGRIERRSLLRFFNNNMRKDNWNALSQIKAHDSAIMVFYKPSRTAVITIKEEQIYTYVEVAVAPTVTSGTGSLESKTIE